MFGQRTKPNSCWLWAPSPCPLNKNLCFILCSFIAPENSLTQSAKKVPIIMKSSYLAFGFYSCLIYNYQHPKWSWVLFSLLQSLISAKQGIWKPRRLQAVIFTGLGASRESGCAGRDSCFHRLFQEFSEITGRGQGDGDLAHASRQGLLPGAADGIPQDLLPRPQTSKLYSAGPVHQVTASSHRVAHFPGGLRRNKHQVTAKGRVQTE